MKPNTKRTLKIVGAAIVVATALFSGPTIISTLLPGEPMPFGAFAQDKNWNLVFQDPFDTTSVDLTKWTPNWLGGTNSITPPINTSELSCYAPQNVTVADGALVLTAKTSVYGSLCKTRSGTAAYSSGMVQSNGKYNTAYGYFEARIWTPAGPDHKSVWPAFWTNGQPTWPVNGEIDILEAYGTDSSSSYHYHYKCGSSDCQAGGNFTVGGSTTGYHVYAAYWEPGKITWFYDGVQVFQYTTGIVSAPHYIILNLGVIGTQITVPSQMLVDYVRVWKIAPGTPVPTVTGNTQTPTMTATSTVTGISTATRTPTSTRTITPTPTFTATQTATPTPTNTWTPTNTPTITPSVTNTITPSPTQPYECLLFPVHDQEVCLPYQ